MTNLMKRLLCVCVLAAMLTPGVLAANATALDPGTSVDWNLWILSGLLGLILFLMSLNASLNSTEVEIDAIISVMAWIPIAFCAYSSFSISRFTGTNYQTIYSMGTVGMLMVAFLLLAIGNTLRLILLHRVFAGEPKQQEVDV